MPREADGTAIGGYRKRGGGEKVEEWRGEGVAPARLVDGVPYTCMIVVERSSS